MSVLSALPDPSVLDFTEPLTSYLAGSQLLAYVILGATTMPPLVPNSAILVTSGVLAARGGLNVAVVIAVVALSALLGDMLIHRGGRALSAPVLGRLYHRPRRRALLEWTSYQIQRHGVPFVIACRFLPSGRLFGGLSAGIMRFPAPRYLVGAMIAEVVWASYSVGLGYVGGHATSRPLYAVGLGLGVSSAVAAVGWLAQVVARRRRRGALPGVASPAATPAGAMRGGSGAWRVAVGSRGRRTAGTAHTARVARAKPASSASSASDSRASFGSFDSFATRPSDASPAEAAAGLDPARPPVMPAGGGGEPARPGGSAGTADGNGRGVDAGQPAKRGPHGVSPAAGEAHPGAAGPPLRGAGPGSRSPRSRCPGRRVITTGATALVAGRARRKG